MRTCLGEAPRKRDEVGPSEQTRSFVTSAPGPRDSSCTPVPLRHLLQNFTHAHLFGESGQAAIGQGSGRETDNPLSTPKDRTGSPFVHRGADEGNAENLRNSGHLLRGWLSVQKIAEVKRAVLDGKP